MTGFPNPIESDQRAYAVREERPPEEGGQDADEVRERYMADTRAAVDKLDLSNLPYPRQRFENFSTAVLRRVDDRYLRAHSGKHIADQLADSLCFVNQRERGQIAVRVFQPTEEASGYGLDGTIIETLMEDQPFIFDTLKLFLSFGGVRIRNAMNVILGLDRDPSGKLTAVYPNLGGGQKESYCRLYVDMPRDGQSHEALAMGIKARLGKSREMVGDFHRMKKTALDLANEFEYLPSLDALCSYRPYLMEAADFLRWMVDDNFIFMGMSFFSAAESGAARAQPARGLGIKAGEEDPCGEGGESLLDFFSLSRGIDKYFVQVRKSQEESLIHRSGMVDEVVVRRFDLDGKPVGGVVVHGLFTYKAISSAGGSIPILRRKLSELPQLEDTPRDSYLYKATEDAFNSLPVEYLFNGTSAEISRLIHMMLRTDNDQAMSVHLSVEEGRRSAYLFVVVPKKDYSDDLRESIEALVKARLEASYADHRAFIGKSGTVVLHFFLSGRVELNPVSEEALTTEIMRLCSPWREQLRFELESRLGEDAAHELCARYADEFGEAYRATHDAVAAADDVLQFERVRSGKHQVLAIRPGARRIRSASPQTRSVVDLVLYQARNLYLTDVLPKFHNFGLRVIDQFAHNISLPNGQVYVVDTFRIDATGIESTLLDDSARVIEAMDAVFDEVMASSPLNRLVISAGLTWQQVEILRGYSRYSRQLGGHQVPEVTYRILDDNPAAVRAMVHYFAAKFDPDVEGGACEPNEARRAAMKAAEGEFQEALQGISSFVEDRLFRTYFNLIDATLRTNAYRTDRKFPYLSFKFDCARVESMRDPRPWREIYVHHVNVEGVHLRGGPSARGGLRWSDRLDDYRSEVLDLMTTQMVKNTLIVPVGAKGGFVVHHPPSQDADLRAYADEMYRTFIRGLLDVTDNREGSAIIPPPRVVRFDGDDPYLVVAADKGTAHLSDTANAISEEYGFWLGDAFASGGSNGYDHKVEGITAKGAWACVREHFREIGVDPEVDVVRTVGIGDMGGDVFGNGMLLSRTLKLVGAFNHRHIFIDPDPDPEASFLERERLFALPRSNWRDYDPRVMSEGGAVYDRGAKSITLSEPAQTMLGLERDTLSPAELISALLSASVDLLWNGGIGTYVKASTEAHRDATDKSNDDVRIDAPQLRAKVVGEGGNLGITQAARIEYALLGGRVNTDFVDNAGGVNLSDHEVNLKVLYAPLVQSGQMAMEERNHLLRKVAADIVDQVVGDNRLLSLRLSLDELRSRRDVYAFGRTTKALKTAGVLDTARQRLPTLKRLTERAADGHGLTRPELATLGSHAKMHAYAELVKAPRLPQRVATRFLQAYFPESVYARFESAIGTHLLVHEIVSTVATNLIVDFAGTTFFSDLSEDTGRSVEEIALTYIVANELLGTWELKERVRAAELGLSAHAEQTAILSIEDAVRDVVILFLHTLTPGKIRSWDDAEIEARRTFASEQSQSLERWLDEGAGGGRAERGRSLQAHGLPKELADAVSRLSYGVAALAADSVARAAGTDATDTLRAYVSLASAFGIGRLHQRLAQFSSADAWEVMAMRAMRRAVFDHHAALSRAALASGAPSRGRSKQPWPVASWLESQPALGALAAEMRRTAEHNPSIAALVVLSDRLSGVLRAMA